MIVVLTALQVEHNAIRRHMAGLRAHPHPAGTHFEIGALAQRQDRRVALAVLGTGNSGAAALTERAIAEFQPDAVILVGIAGALRDWLRIGDVIVATKIYGYHGGRSDDGGFRARPQAWLPSHRLEQLARHMDSTDTWQSLLPDESARPNVHFLPIAAGEVVLDSTSSALARQLREHYNDAVAVEMESSGMAHASHLNLSVPAITIRGISDFAFGTKDFTDESGGPRQAADHAAAFAAALIAQLDDTGPPPERQRATPVNVYNQTSGYVENVFQVGVLNGGFHGEHPKRPALPDLLVELAEAILADHRAGHIDADTLEGGMAALYDIRTRHDTKRRAEAVRRLNELLGDRPALGAMITRIAID